MTTTIASVSNSEQLSIAEQEKQTKYEIDEERAASTDEVASVKEVDEVIDDWGLSTDHNFHLFAQHEIRTVYMMRRKLQLNRQYHNSFCLRTKKQSEDGKTTATTPIIADTVRTVSSILPFSILCVETLTPIDMVDLGYGIHDATCHCVWTGSFLFIAALNNVLYPYIFVPVITITTAPIMNSTDTVSIDLESKNIHAHRRTLHILELGCGTGIGSIGIWTAACDRIPMEEVEGEETNDTMFTPTKSSSQSLHLTVTDADPEALKLCRRNFELNEIPTMNYDIESLYWGDEIVASKRFGQRVPYDVVFATDVLYDITVLVPLLQTSYNCLCQHGYFILSHVPRACYKSTHPPPVATSLNDYIIHCATVQHGGFQLVRVVQPMECCDNHENDDTNESPLLFPKDALNSTTLQEMQDIGASIFIFQRK